MTSISSIQLKDSPETISIEDAWNENQLWIDVRTPAEFCDGHVPDAVNVPLFSNQERAVVGTLYKQVSQEKAYEEGLRFAESNLKGILDQIEQNSDKRPLTIYCARGGMRSKSITLLLKSLGYNVRQLVGGYKRFRNWNLEQLDLFSPKHPLIILHGPTGVGKTLLLHQLPNSLDLEGLAQHRSSLFGGIGKSPVSQKQFEANLLKRLLELDLNTPVFVEGESRKVGSAQIPSHLFDLMKQGTMILVEADSPIRVQRTMEDYVNLTPENHQQIKDALYSLRHFLSNQVVEDLLVQAEQKNYPYIVSFLYEHYYDPKYNHTMRHYQYAHRLSSNDLETAVRQLTEIQQSLG